jgi:hypothetical protein
MFSFSLGGSRGSSSSRTTSTEKGTQTTQRLNDRDQFNLRSLIDMFSGELQSDGPFTREAALADISGMVDNLFRNYRESTVPQIMTQQQQTGGFGQSTAQLMANDAFARTVAEGAGLQFGAVTGYEQLQNQRRQTSLSGLGTNLEALLRSLETTSIDTTVESKTRGKSSSMSLGGGFGPA